MKSEEGRVKNFIEQIDKIDFIDKIDKIEI